MDIETIILATSYLGIFFLMIVNGFISFPSSQLLYIIVGYFSGTGFLSAIPAVFIGALGNTIGNIILYEIVRKNGISYIKRFRLFHPREIKKVEILFRKRGLWFLFVGKLLPTIKVFIPIPAALGKVDRRIFGVTMFVASLIWALFFVMIGIEFGKSVHLVKSYFIVLGVIGLVVAYLFYRLMNTKEVLHALELEGDGGDIQ
jgi:alkaline phosphatase